MQGPDCRSHAAHVQALEDPSDRDKFSPLIQPMLACLGATLNAGDEASAQEALENFIDGGRGGVQGLDWGWDQ